MKIYYAAPLHEDTDRQRNAKYAQQLREAGHHVYLPQEHGIWEALVEERVVAGMPKEEAIAQVRATIYKWDLSAMQCADCCVAYAGARAPSEGMLWEMGFMTGVHKPVYLFNPHTWRYNLMPEFGSTQVFDSWMNLMNHLAEESFR